MYLQGLIVVVVHVAVLLAAQVTRQVHSVEVLLEAVDVEEVLLAEIAPGVRQYLGAPVAGRITMLNMVPQFLHVIDALLPHKYSAPF